MTQRIGSRPATAPLGSGVASLKNKADLFLEKAMAFKGQWYQWGGGHIDKTFDKPGPVDCSGLVQQAARMAGLNLDGTAAVQQGMGKAISPNDLKPGDLVFCNKPATHVGIYIGNNQVLEAPTTGSQVKVSTYNTGRWDGGCRRVFDEAGQPINGEIAEAAGSGTSSGSSSGAGSNGAGSSGMGSDATSVGGGSGAPSRLSLPGGGRSNGPRAAGPTGGSGAAPSASPEPAGPAPSNEPEETSSAEAPNWFMKNWFQFLQDLSDVGMSKEEQQEIKRMIKSGKLDIKAMLAKLKAKGVPADKLAGLEAKFKAAMAKGKTLEGTTTKDGHRLPATEGRATTFWNGHHEYKGERDTMNMSIGAWGDENKPTDYFVALPVGLNGEADSKWWHNQKILVTNPDTGKQVVARVQDKGPHPRTGNAIDMSPVAKEALGVGFNDNLNVKIEFAPDDADVGPVN